MAIDPSHSIIVFLLHSRGYDSAFEFMLTVIADGSDVDQRHEKDVCIASVRLDWTEYFTHVISINISSIYIFFALPSMRYVL